MKQITRPVYVLLVSLFFFASCSSNDQFEISKNKVGKLNASTTIQEIETLFKNDSIVKHLSEGVLGYNGTYSQDEDKYHIYSEAGKHLLTITPKESLDSLSTIKYVDIFDAKFTTKEGIGLNSTFEEINFLTHIAKVDATFTKVLLYMDKLNATFSLPKDAVGLKPMSTGTIQIDQIPNKVKPVSFVVWFE